MFYRSSFVAVLLASLTSGLPISSAAAQGEIIITQAKANAGGVTPGDDCYVEGNTVSDNRLVGVWTHSGTVLGNTIFSNGQYGIIDADGPADTGFGDNTVVGNNNNADQVHNVVPLHPNYCSPNPC